MCLIYLKTEEKVKEYKREQPDEFDVWKVVLYGNTPPFRTLGNVEPRLQLPNRVYKARYFPSRRAELNYKPGFHVFRTKRQARSYQERVGRYFGLSIRRFRARKEWIENIGKVDGITCLVLSHIKTLKTGEE